MAGTLQLYLSVVFLGLVLWIVDCSHSSSGDYGCSRLDPPFYGALVFNGSEVVADQQPSWRENDTVSFVCNPGYLLLGSSGQPLGRQLNITCEAPEADGSGSGQGNGTSVMAWSQKPEQLLCSRVDCGRPYDIANGSFSFNGTDLFSTAQYSCNPGYQLTGGAEYSVCWWDGVWRPQTISCTAIPPDTVCSDPPTISDGDRTWEAGDMAPVGTTVTYTCDSGYELDGAAVIACDISGKWTSPPTCTATGVLSSTEIYVVEGAGAAAIIFILSAALCIVSCIICRIKMKQRQYIEDEEALAQSGAFTLSNPLVKDEDAAGNPLYLTPDELNEFEQQQ